MTCELFGVHTCSLYILKGHILKRQDGRDITETEFEDLPLQDLNG